MSGSKQPLGEFLPITRPTNT